MVGSIRKSAEEEEELQVKPREIQTSQTVASNAWAATLRAQPQTDFSSCPPRSQVTTREPPLLTWSELEELRSLRTVSPMVRRCLELVYTVLHLDELHSSIEKLHHRSRYPIEWTEITEMLTKLQKSFAPLNTFDFKALVYGHPEVYEYLTRTYLCGPSALTEKAIYSSSQPCTALYRWFRRGIKTNPLLPRSMNIIQMLQHRAKRISVEPSDFDAAVHQSPPKKAPPKFSPYFSKRRRGPGAEEVEEIPGNFEIHEGKVELVRGGWMRLPFWITVPVRIALFLAIPKELPTARLVYVLGQHTLG
mmetsp:Transcript_29599/g.64593  ORF Transcript_29599/g.64593 Transcript_29599/m.64593 type:complete len:305 (-) Transcript_29599:2-916(-)